MHVAESESSTSSSGSLLTTSGRSAGVRLDEDALHDLALDQVIARIAAVVGEDLAQTLTVPLTDVLDIRRRQDTFRVLAEPATRAVVEAFIAAVASHDSSRTAAAKTYSSVEADLWILHAAATYVAALETLATDLPAALDSSDVTSAALDDVAQLCAERVQQDTFGALRDRVGGLGKAVRDVRLSVWLQGGTVTVARFDDEPDDVATVRDVFARFEGHGRPQHHVDTSRTPRTSGRRMDAVQSQILSMSASLHPEVFGALHTFATAAGDVVDEFARRFVRDAGLFLAWLDVLAPVQRAGLEVCYPTVTARHSGVDAEGIYDLALAPGLLEEHVRVVPNDLHLDPSERLLVVTGPNQGGKTTFARTIGQLHHLAAVGLPVPGRSVELGLSDRVLTHFERPERLDNLAGRLGEGLQRMKALLESATEHSVIVLNEVFTSTTVDDARFLTREMLARAHKIGALVVCVTFIDDIAAFDDATVSMVADVDPADSARRTFHLARRPADGLAYAHALAQRHGLTAATIRKRLEARA